MIRKGTALGIIILALFLVAAAQPANAQLELTETQLVVASDATASWEAEPGDTDEPNIQVNVCWTDPAVNPQEGSIEVTTTLPADTAELAIRFSDPDDETLVFPLPPTDQGAQGDELSCSGRQTFTLVVELLQEFNEDSHTHPFELEFTAAKVGDTGTFAVPPPASDTMNIEITKPEPPPGAGNGDDETDTETDDNPPETEDSPAPGLAVFTVLSLALFAVFRRRE